MERSISRKSKGYILVATCLALVFLLGVAGLAIDIGRMYITRREAQSFVDSAVFSAALQLDGTTAGITRAQAAVASNPKKWGFQVNPFTNVTTSFAQTSSGPWTTAPPNPPTGYVHARVSTTVSLPMYLIVPLTHRDDAAGRPTRLWNRPVSECPKRLIPYSLVLCQAAGRALRPRGWPYLAGGSQFSRC
jgi:Flp pilus assembly protein TadG